MVVGFFCFFVAFLVEMFEMRSVQVDCDRVGLVWVVKGGFFFAVGF